MTIKLVPRESPFGGGRPIGSDAEAALHRLWTGEGTPKDAAMAGELVRHARDAGEWIGCACRSDDAPALMAPALLRTHGTYYLRRLTGPERPSHDPGCPFYREPALGADAIAGFIAPDRPGGFFQTAHAGDRAREAQKDPDGASAPRASDGAPRHPSTLRRQFWRLIDEAHLNRIDPPSAGSIPSYKHEFAKLKDAAAVIPVADGVPLSEVFETVPSAIARRSIFAKIRHARGALDAPAGLQGFVCCYSADVTKDRLTAMEETVVPIGGIDIIPGGPPYLCLIVVGDREGRGLVPLRGVAQPVLDGRQYFPILAQSERERARALIDLQRRLGVEDNVRLRLFRSLFSDSPDGEAGDVVVGLYSRDAPLHEEFTVERSEFATRSPDELTATIRAWARTTHYTGH